jgi:predicted nuclease of restriction endonuclease-like (RecB) superfamily
MQNFYVSYQGKAKLQPLLAEIGWMQNLIIVTRCKDNLERAFYIRTF